MKICLFTIPAEPSNLEVDRSSRSEGQFPILPKIAIISLIKWMAKHGYEENQYSWLDIDMLLSSDEEIVDFLRREKPTIVGLSAVVSTSYSQVKRISSLIRKERPDCWIVCGGALTATSNVVLRKTEVDLTVVGDGELPWISFLEYTKSVKQRELNELKLNEIKGLAYIGKNDDLIFTGYGDKIPSNEMPYPDYHILKNGLDGHADSLDNYFRKGLEATWFRTDPRSFEKNRRPNLANVWITKGCVARCTFCQRSVKGYRVSDVASLDEHLEELKNKFDVGFIHITDENFASNKKHTYEVVQVLNKHGMLWVASGVRCTSVKDEDVKFYKENGCSGFKYGVESGAQEILDIMEKRFTTDQVFRALNYCAKYEVYSPLAVMVGMPGETLETAQKTGEFIGKCCHIQAVPPEYNGVSIFYALPLPGTPLYEYGQQIGLIGTTPSEEEEYLLMVSGTGADKINYVNLNGARMKDVLFWEKLVQLEASRTYRELCKKQLPISTHLSETLIKDKVREIKEASESQRIIRQKEVGAFGFSFKGWKQKLFKFITYFIEKRIVGNRLVDSIPRGIAYPVIQNLIYFEYLLQKVVVKVLGKNFNLYSEQVKVQGFNEEHKKAKDLMGRSLRGVVRKARLDSGGNVTEENRQTLVRGL